MMNCPNDPAAPTMPSAVLRLLAGTARPTTPKTIEKPVQPSATPISRPLLKLSSRLVPDTDISASPMA